MGMRFSCSFSLNRNFADDFCRYGGGVSFFSQEVKMIQILSVGAGGFTTFSTFSLESLALIQEGRFLVFMAYAVSSVALCLLAVWLGHMAAALI